MQRLLLLTIAFSTILPLMGQETFSRAIPRDYFGQPITEIQTWGHDYLLRIGYFNTNPIRVREELMLIDSAGWDVWRATFRNSGSSGEWTKVQYGTSADGTATQISYCVTACDNGDEKARLTRFDKDGEVLQSDTLRLGGIPDFLRVYTAGPNVRYIRDEQQASPGGLATITTTELDSNLQQSATATYEKEGVNIDITASYFDGDGFYTIHRELSGTNQNLGWFATKRNLALDTIYEMPLPTLSAEQSNGYVSIQPLPNGGLAILEGFRSDRDGIICNGEQGCPPSGSVLGVLHVYREVAAPPVTHNLRFIAKGLQVLGDGEVVVYGETYGPFSQVDKTTGVLYRTSAWPSGSQFHLIPAYSSEPGGEGYTDAHINTMVLDGNGCLVGGGELYDDPSDFQGLRADWIFRLNSNGCFTPDCSIIIPVDDITSVRSASQDISTAVEVRPNPSYGTLTVEGFSKRAGYKLLTASGRLLARGRLNGDGTINLGSTPPGLYYLHLFDDGVHAVKKIISK